MTVIYRAIHVVVAAVLFAAVSGAAFAQQQKRLALVIGNSDYTGAPLLRNPVNDARAMAAKLEQLHFKVITVLNGSYRQMMTAENTFADELNRYEVGLFYFSGHGVQYQGTNYLVPVNAKIERAVDIQFEALNADRVLADMESAGTQVNIMILDACRNDPFVSQFRSATRGLSVVQAPAGSLVVYSTAPDQVALDGRGQHSPFTGALLAHLATPGVSIQDMLTGVFQQVQQETRGEQVPWESSSLTVPFYFAAKAPQVAAAPQPAPAAQGAPSPAPSPSAPPAPQPQPQVAQAPSEGSPSGPAPATQPAPTPSPSSVGSQSPQVAAAPPPATSATKPGEVAVTITTNGWSADTHLVFAGPKETKKVVIQTFGFSPPVITLAPGYYTVTGSLGEDPGIGYRGHVDVKSGQQVDLTIPIDYTTGYKITLAQEQRYTVSSNLVQLEENRRRKNGTAAFLSLLGVAGGIGAYFSYEAGASAYGFYEGATTTSSATSYRSQVLSYNTITLASGIGSAVFLLRGLGELSTRPAALQITNLQHAVARLDAQIAALKAQESIGR